MAPTDSTAEDPGVGSGREIRALGRGLEVLRLFAADRPSLSLTEISDLAGLPLPTTQRVVRTLEHHGFLLRDAERGPYRLGSALLSLVSPLFGALTVADVARPFLEVLAERTAEAANLAVLDAGEVLYLASSSAQRLLTTSVVPGARLPAHCTALGKALLAQLDDTDARAALGDEPYERRTGRTLTRWPELMADLGRIRADGHALSEGEYEEGLSACAVPVPIPSWQTPAAVNVSAPGSRWSHEQMIRTVVPALHDAAVGIRATFGALRVQPAP
jgi:DNA-binding IclR family transcriptional regulator